MSEFRLVQEGEYVQCYIPSEDKWLYFVAIIHGMKSTGNTEYIFTEDVRAATKCTAAQWVAESLSRVFVSMVLSIEEAANGKTLEQTVV